MDYKESYDYYCFIDETNIDSVISIDDKGIINIEKDNQFDIFVTISLNIRREDIEIIRTDYSLFESRAKSMYSLSDDVEFKSTIIKRKNFTYGISSFNENAFAFYKGLFEIMDNHKIDFYLSALSKTEYLVQFLFSEDILPGGTVVPSFYYTLAKFIKQYAEADIFLKMRDLSSQHKRDQFRRYLIKKIQDVCRNTQNATKYNRQNDRYSDLINILSMIDFNGFFYEKMKFDTNYAFDGLIFLFKSRSILIEDVCVVIDGEDEPLCEKTTYQRIDHYFPHYYFVDSREEDLIRLSDNVAGFIGRMIHSIRVDLDRNNKTEYESGKTISELNSINCLSAKWFDVNEKQFGLYRLIHKVFIQNQKDYWNTFSSGLSDEVSYFYELIDYFGSYDDYNQYCMFDCETHAMICNGCVCRRINHRFSQWTKDPYENIISWYEMKDNGGCY